MGILFIYFKQKLVFYWKKYEILMTYCVYAYSWTGIPVWSRQPPNPGPFFTNPFRDYNRRIAKLTKEKMPKLAEGGKAQVPVQLEARGHASLSSSEAAGQHSQPAVMAPPQLSSSSPAYVIATGIWGPLGF